MQKSLNPSCMSERIIRVNQIVGYIMSGSPYILPVMRSLIMKGRAGRLVEECIHLFYKNNPVRENYADFGLDFRFERVGLLLSDALLITQRRE